MLKIIMDSREAHKYIGDTRYVNSPNAHFNRMKEQEWFSDALVKKIINDIDNSRVVIDFAVINNKSGIGYSVDTISGGSKFLILAHKLRDRIYLATMGDNCTDFLEQIALDYEKEGKDLYIVSDYMHKFNFKYIKEIEYVNWEIICRSWQDVCDTAYKKYMEHTKK